MRKPVFAICEQQRRRSACASAQSDQRLCCSLSACPSPQSDQCLCCLLLRSCNSSSLYIQNFKPLPSFCGCAGQFESYLVANPKDRFSRDKAQMQIENSYWFTFIFSVPSKIMLRFTSTTYRVDSVRRETCMPSQVLTLVCDNMTHWCEKNVATCDFHVTLTKSLVRYMKHGFTSTNGPSHAKMCLMPYANNKGADQPVHPHSLISIFVGHCLDSMICILATSKVSRF